MQAPTIYRLFGDKDGLLEAVAEHVMADYVSGQGRRSSRPRRPTTSIPLDDLRAGWRTQIDFGVANPALFRLLSDPDRAAALARPPGRASEVLQARVHRVAPPAGCGSARRVRST